MLRSPSIDPVKLPVPLQLRTFRDSASFGRRHEYIAAAALLQRGFDVYMTLVDDQGIDCVIRLDEKNYIDVQIKARSAKAKQPSFFAAMKFQPRANLWFIFYTECSSHYWVMPSRDVARFSHQNKSGKNLGKYSLNLPKRDVGIKAVRFARYQNDAGFNLMRALVKPKRRPH
jgi:hypothetical protein